jgi:hypothetical protein
MDALQVRAMTVAVAAGTLSLGLAVAALAGPPVAAFNASQDAVRMSILRSTMLTQRTAATQKTTAANPKPTPTTTAAPSQKATSATHTTGQPNQTCGSASAPTTPGNAWYAPGSAFNPNGKAGMVYAGTRPQNSKNPTSVAQYDVACSHQPR